RDQLGQGGDVSDHSHGGSAGGLDGYRESALCFSGGGFDRHAAGDGERSERQCDVWSNRSVVEQQYGGRHSEFERRRDGRARRLSDHHGYEFGQVRNLEHYGNRSAAASSAQWDAPVRGGFR